MPLPLTYPISTEYNGAAPVPGLVEDVALAQIVRRGTKGRSSGRRRARFFFGGYCAMVTAIFAHHYVQLGAPRLELRIGV